MTDAQPPSIYVETSGKVINRGTVLLTYLGAVEQGPFCTYTQTVNRNSMTTQQAQYIIQLLAGKGIHFDSGLTDDEVLHIEAAFNFTFPPDLQLLLQTALPISYGFVHWRLGLKTKVEAYKIQNRLDWPLDGMLFDLQYNKFWIDSWGTMPDDIESKIEIVKRHFYTYPTLIPIYSHRYIPSRPNEAGNPVFSVYQTDIIYYGYNLATYFAHEFCFALPSIFVVPEQPKRTVEFWSCLSG